MRYLQLTIVFISLHFFVNGQTEKLNQRDTNGKKDGVWIVFLDKDWHLAKDSMSAVYFRYNYFRNGESAHAMGPWGGKLESKQNSTVKKGNALMLDGEYKWYNSKGQLVCEHVLKNGWYISFKEYFPSSGQLQTFFDYTNHAPDGQQHSYLMTAYNKKGKQIFQGWTDEHSGGKGVDN